MNRLVIIGNLTRDPVLRTTQTGRQVCSFTVAVNRRKTASNQNPEADFFNVTVWEAAAENCARFLQKGRKVGVVGSVSVRTYTGQDGRTYASLEVNAQEVEFLTPLSEVSPVAPPEPVPQEPQAAPAPRQQTFNDVQAAGFTPVDVGDELPF